MDFSSGFSGAQTQQDIVDLKTARERGLVVEEVSFFPAKSILEIQEKEEELGMVLSNMLRLKRDAQEVTLQVGDYKMPNSDKATLPRNFFEISPREKGNILKQAWKSVQNPVKIKVWMVQSGGSATAYVEVWGTDEAPSVEDEEFGPKVFVKYERR